MNNFKLPIIYNDSKIELSENVKSDLELTSDSVYGKIFGTNDIISDVATYYTTDVAFLKDTQKMLKKHDLSVDQSPLSIEQMWNEITYKNQFKEKYNYIEWDFLEFLNKSHLYLQTLSIYNILSPILALAVPIMMMIIPFFILKFKGIMITIKEYTEELKKIMNSHSIGRLFVFDFKKASVNDITYVIISALFWIYSVYQNFSNCFKFNKNMCQICDYVNSLEVYLRSTIDRIIKHHSIVSTLPTYTAFTEGLHNALKSLMGLYEKVKMFSAYSFNMLHLQHTQKNGKLLQLFYELNSSTVYNEAIQYSIGFNKYIDCITSLRNYIDKGQIVYTTFTNNKEKMRIINNCYVPLAGSPDTVLNNIDLNTNHIITGPNASGKTTILKSVLINIILSQQFGCGFYAEAVIKPFTHLHSYLNIPDTSGRDSLFQAEARRCKNIIDCIDKTDDELHFCIFDELYSGTNPDEALTSGINFIKYISKNKNVKFMLTTHFSKICNKKYKNTENFKMKTEEDLDNGDLHYNYILEKGVSLIKGGSQVLKQLSYPKEFFLKV